MESLKQVTDCEHNLMTDKELFTTIYDSERVVFGNGCCVCRDHREYEAWGITPYGLDSLCVDLADIQHAVDTIRTWLGYWDEPRSESGRLMNVDAD